jgi:Enoyl-[acyl-carrier-protein] reductase (NADH)
MKAAGWGRIIFYLQRIRCEHSDRNDPLRRNENHAGGARPRTGRNHRGNRRDRQFGAAGPTRSEGVEKFIDDLAKAKHSTPAAVEKEFFTTARPTSLLRRFATPDEVAALVAFVASPLSSATNGAALRADGGVVRSIL